MNKRVIIGGAIGLLVVVLTILVRCVFGVPIARLFNLFSIIQLVLFGLLAGIISQQFIPMTTEKSIIRNTGIMFLVTFIAPIIIGIILNLFFNIRYIRIIKLLGFRFIDRIIGDQFRLTLQYFIISIICSVAVFVFLKISHNKGLLPFVESTGNKSHKENVSERNSIQNESQPVFESKFDGGFWHFVGLCIGGFLVCLITLGIAFPWVNCWFIRWRINHTVVSGKRLQFNGTGLSLFGHFILRGWLLGIILTPLTLCLYPIYYFQVSLRKWEVKNTSLVNN